MTSRMSSGSRPAGERGRADQVDEHHRELPPLGLGGGAAGRARCGARPAGCAGEACAGPQGGDGVEQLAPVADRGDAEAAQVVGRQLGQDLGVDVVVAERLLVLAQAQPAQPSPDVHPVPPIGRARPRRVQSIPSRPWSASWNGTSGAAFSSPVAGKVVRAAFDGGRLTSDAGVLVLAEIERRLGIAERLARCIADPRSPERVHHTLAEMIRFRVLLIAAGYPDANDCDALRADPAFKMALGRAPESGPDLCSQPTMCRLENLPTTTALKRMMAAMVELFCDSFERGAAPDRARHRRHRGPGPRRPGARALPRPLRRALLPADPRLRGDHRQAGGGDPAPRQDPGRGRGGARPAPRDPRASAPAGRRSTSWSAATATTAGRRR